ncbi:MAG: class I SAM-dependent methyltransferase [Actinomycetota bacterium]|nr:class I SAM-dependent methyltransferase [Actinomycetota bacterium]
MPDVTGLDRDERCIELARSRPDADDIAYVHDDFLTRPLSEGSFDLVTSVAALHHMDTAAALERMSGLLRPGGVLAVIGLARGSSLVDVALTVPAVIGGRLHLVASDWHRRRCPSAETYQSPVIWPPPVTYRDIWSLAGRILTQARYRRHLYWRYSLIWSKPS